MIEAGIYFVAGLDESDCVWACGSPDPAEGSDLICTHGGACDGEWLETHERPEVTDDIEEAKAIVRLERKEAERDAEGRAQCAAEDLLLFRTRSI